MRVNSSMTVFNRHADPLTKNVTYKSHIIENVFWDNSKGVNLDKGYDKADSVNAYVPLMQNDMTDYVPPRQYDGSSNKWTLAEGDYIVRGNVNIAEINKIQDISSIYDTFIITVCDLKDFGSQSLQHFEIRGK